eukprot:scaffold604_cov270-Chaetoceros_neogracile.AAC.14
MSAPTTWKSKLASNLCACLRTIENSSLACTRLEKDPYDFRPSCAKNESNSWRVKVRFGGSDRDGRDPVFHTEDVGGKKDSD